MAISKTLGGKALTDELRKLANEAVSIDNEGNPIRRMDVLAELIWKDALGWVEETRDDSGSLQRIVHPPLAWAKQFLWDRLEGKAALAVPEESRGIRAAEKVRELALARLNNSALASMGPPKPKTP
jgi:hypothetical protein